MASVGHHEQVVSEELVREHAAGWHAFTQFTKYATGAVVVLLVLMALFLL
ncbi:aa3-type cytochrome c oxidase subunit IV [Azospirillum sp.]|nr:aa3-type cytochrome c oxidase subunit IV [Azospirillum sp.]HYD70314.1 aa3-type cytochrome c oxidase subunit IV [Azospirillum sp.]